LKAGVWLRRERLTMTAPFHGSFRPAESEVITYQAVRLTEATSAADRLDRFIQRSLPGEALPFTLDQR
jgi:hypothetical protein